MTLTQFESLSFEELALASVIINEINPPELIEKIDFTPKQLLWFRHDLLIKRILEVFPRLKPEGHAIYSSLLTKLGVQHEIKYEQPPQPVTASAEQNITSSNQEITGSK